MRNGNAIFEMHTEENCGNVAQKTWARGNPVPVFAK